MDHGFSVVSHQTDQSGVPLVGDFNEGGRTRRHENLPDPVVPLLDALVVDTDESLRCDLLGVLILQLPHAILLREFLLCGAALGQDSDFESTMVKQKIGVVFGEDRHEGVLPLDRCQRPRQSILDFPEDCTAQVDIVLHKAHAAVTWPALLVVIPDDVFIVRVRVLSQETLYQVS